MESPLAVINILVAEELEELTIQTIHLMMAELEEEVLEALPHQFPTVRLELLTPEAVEAEMENDQLKLGHLDKVDLV